MGKMVHMNEIRQIRVARGFTLQELADRVQTTATQISRLELGTRKLTPQWRRKIAGALNVRESLLVKIDEDSDPEIYSKLLDEQNVVDKFFLPKVIDTISGSEIIDKKFLIICFETVSTMWDIAENKKIVSPRLCLATALAMHEAFLALYKKIGSTVELLAALRHFVIFYLSKAFAEAGVTGEGDSGPLDEQLALFRDALDPTFDPVELAELRRLEQKMEAAQRAQREKVKPPNPGEV
jgi:transcriptional regulator with XRE-family HTH domain